MSQPDFVLTLQRDLKQTLTKDIGKVILQLKESLPEKAIKYNDVIAIEGRLNQINLQSIRGVITNEQKELSYNQIRQDLILLIDTLQESDFRNVAQAAANKGGQLLYQIPQKMKMQEEVKCIIRLAHSEAQIVKNIELTADTKLKPVRISKIMQVNLVDPNEHPVFNIRTYSDTEQFLEASDYTEWVFYVKPLSKGVFPLVLKISVVELINNVERLKNIVLEEVINVTTEAEKLIPDTDFRASSVTFLPSSKYKIGVNEAQSTSSARPVTSLSSKSKPGKRLLSVVAGMFLVFGTIIAFPVIKDEIAWKNVEDSDSAKVYLSKYPDGRHADEARLLLEDVDTNSMEDNKANTELIDANEERMDEEKIDKVLPAEYDQSVNQSDDASQVETVKDENLEVVAETKTSEPTPKNTTVDISDVVEVNKVDNTDSKTIESTVVEKEEVETINEQLSNRNFGTGYMVDPRDGKKYNIVYINGQHWMAENLDFKMPGSWYYKDQASSKDGRLYIQAAAAVACPKGWHLPSDKEWESLTLSAGGYMQKGYKKKNPGKAFLLLRENGPANFNIRFSGKRNTDGTFETKGSLATYWTSTLSSQNGAYNYFFSTVNSSVNRDNNASRNNAFSCRCVRDE